MDERTLQERARRPQRRDQAVIDHLIDQGIDGKPPKRTCPQSDNGKRPACRSAGP